MAALIIYYFIFLVAAIAGVLLLLRVFVMLIEWIKSLSGMIIRDKNDK